MAGYYELLQHSGLGRSISPEERQAAYDRARHVQLQKLLAEEPPLSGSFITDHQALLEAAIQKFEADLAQQSSSGDRVEAETSSQTGIASRRAHTWLLVCLAFATGLLAIGLLGYLYRADLWSFAGSQGPRGIPAGVVEFDDRKPTPVAGSADDTVPYIFRRQLVYYRTTQPTGTIVIDKAQRYLYQVRSAIVAARYGIGVGRECLGAGGLLRISRKEERLISSSQQAAGSQDSAFQTDSPRSETLFGSRTIHLDSNARFIHGTKVPKSIGRSVWLGCFRLIDNDVIELYDRVSVGGRVVVVN